MPAPPELEHLEEKLRADGLVAHEQEIESLEASLSVPRAQDIWARKKIVLGGAEHVMGALRALDGAAKSTDVWARSMARASFASGDLGGAWSWAEEAALRSRRPWDLVKALQYRFELGLSESVPLLRALVRSETTPDALGLASVILINMGHEQEAETAATQALAQRADTPDALYALGVIHLRRGEHAEAIDRLSRAVAMVWDRPEWSVWLASAHSLAEQHTDSLRAAMHGLERYGFAHYLLVDAACVGFYVLSPSSPDYLAMALTCADRLVELAESGVDPARRGDAHARRAIVLMAAERRDEAELSLQAALAHGGIDERLREGLREWGFDLGEERDAQANRRS